MLASLKDPEHHADRIHFAFDSLSGPQETILGEWKIKWKLRFKGLGFRVYWGYIGIMENKMETTIAYWGYTGIMEGLETLSKV